MSFGCVRARYHPVPMTTCKPVLEEISLSLPGCPLVRIPSIEHSTMHLCTTCMWILIIIVDNSNGDNHNSTNERACIYFSLLNDDDYDDYDDSELLDGMVMTTNKNNRFQACIVLKSNLEAWKSLNEPLAKRYPPPVDLNRLTSSMTFSSPSRTILSFVWEKNIRFSAAISTVILLSHRRISSFVPFKAGSPGISSIQPQFWE